MGDDTSLYVAEQLLFLGGRLNRTASQLLLSFDFGTVNFVVIVASSVFNYILTRGLSPERS